MFGVSVPLRYAFDTDLSVREQRFSVSAGLTTYSDQQFTADFSRREEDIDWSRVIGLGEEDTGTGRPTSAYSWDLTASVNPRFDVLSPIVQTARVSRLSAALNWRSRTIPTEELPDFVVEADSSPDATFFFPQSLSAPTLQGQISGTPISIPTRRAREGSVEADEQLPDLRPPWPEAPTEPESEGDDGLDLVLPAVEGNVAGLQFADPLSLSVTYSLRPTFSSEWFYEDEPWTTPDLIDWTQEYARYTGSAGGTIGTDVRLYSDLLSIGSDLTVSAQLRDVFDRGPSVEDQQWRSLRENAYRFSSQSLKHAATVNTTPISDGRLLGKSSIAYSLTTLLFSRDFVELNENDEPEYEVTTVEWTEDFVQAHQIGVNLVLRALDADQSLRITSRLPPLDAKHDASLTVVTGPLTSRISAGIEMVEDEWVPGVLSVTETLKLLDDLTLVSDLDYDIDEEWLTSVSASLSYGIFDASFDAERTRGYDFVDATTGFVRREEDEFLPAGFNVGIEPAYEVPSFWRDRVTLSAGADALWNVNLLRFTDSTFSFSTNFSLDIHEFLTITFASQSRNSSTFIYVRPWAEMVGLEPRNVFEDLLKSLNFFDVSDREESYFNVQRLTVSVDHDLGDWELSVNYSGRPEQVTDDDGRRRYEWDRELSFLLQWKPIPELKSAIEFDEEEGILFGE